MLLLIPLLQPAAGESPAERNPIPARCVPAAVAIGSDTLTTWTFQETAAAGRLVDAVLTQEYIDAMTVSWSLAVDPDHPEAFDSAYHSAASRAIRVEDDHVLSYPIEVIQPGWRLIDSQRPMTPGTYQLFWRFGWLARSSDVTVTLTAPAGDPPRQPPVLLRHQLIPYGMDATFTSPAVLAPDGDLIVRVTRIGQDYDHAGVWRSACIEWTRLPAKPGAPTTVFSPFQAGLGHPEPLSAEPATASTLPKEVRFRVADAMRDPRTKEIVPGTYRIRLALAWITTPAASDPLQQPSPPAVSSIRSLHQTIRILAPGEAPPATCSLCGQLILDGGAKHDH